MSRHGNKPLRKAGKTPNLEGPVQPANTDGLPPRFCLHHLQRGYGVKELEKDQQAALILTLAERAQMTWHQISHSDRHGAGSEQIHSNSITCGIPKVFADRDKFLALRYMDLLPMVGVRIGDTFHILWIAQNYGQVYRH